MSIVVEPDRRRTTGERLLELAREFPSLSDAPENLFVPHFNAPRFARFGANGGSGKRDAALFVLGVWNGRTDWTEHGLSNRGSGRFELYLAFANWDQAHHDAFMTWVTEPFWC